MSLLFVSRVSRYFLTSSGRFYALKRVSLSFPNKGLVAIKGKSGSGKSTLLNILSGMDQPNEGKVYFNGSSDLSGKMGNEIAMVFQHYNLLVGLSVLQNVLLPLRIGGGDKKKAMALLKAFGLSRYANKDVRNLSGGEKQRVAICRALVSKPKVIFADEPTGALDEKNSIKVMDALKEVSKHRLVVLVSHNEELIAQYADRVVEIRDGSVVSDTSPLRISKSGTIPTRTRHSISWIPRFVFRNAKSHAIKDFMCFVSGVIGFSALLLSLGFLVGNGPAIEKEQGRTLHYLNASVSKENETSVPGSNIKLIKKTRPSVDETLDFLGEIGDVKIVNDYSYFFPSNMVFSIDGETKSPAQFIPVWDLTLESFGEELLCDGIPSPDNSLGYCLANAEFLDAYGWDLLGCTIETTSRFVLTYEGIKNERFIDARMELIGAVREFGFLNSPRLYYSYQGLEEEISAIEIVGEESSTDIVSLLNDAEPDSSIASYGWSIYLEEPAQASALFKKIDADEGEIKADSLAYGLRTSFLSLSEAFTSSLSLFVGISFSGVALILAMSGFSSLIQGRKDNAILLTQGAKWSDVLVLYATESMILCGISVAISFAICPFLQQFANHFLKKEFDISNLIDIPYSSFWNVPWLLVWGLVLGGCLFGFLSTLIPIAFSKRRNLAQELRDE